MKFLAACVLFFASVQAFAPLGRPFGVRTSVRLFNERPDTSKEVQAALEASKKYGPTSKEARIAWEAVEEMDSADNSAAYTGGVSAEECEIDNSEACNEYHAKLNELAATVGSNRIANLPQEVVKPEKERVKALVQEIQNIRLATPDVKAGSDSPALRQAVKAAKEASDKFGADSDEAKLAWETVEEIGAARNYENAMGGTLEDECLVDKIEACETLEEFQRALNLSAATADGGSG